jgi:hypothetical protein
MTSKALTCSKCQKTLYLLSEQSDFCVCPYCGTNNALNPAAPVIEGLIPEMMSIIMIGSKFQWNDKEYTVNGRILFLCDNGYIMLWYAIAPGSKVWLYESNQDYAVIENTDYNGQSQSFLGKSIGNNMMFAKEKYLVEYYDRVTEIYAEGECKSLGKINSKTIVARCTALESKVLFAFIIDKTKAIILAGTYSNAVDLKFMNTRNADVWNF